VSKRLEVLAAVKVLVTTAAPGALVQGFDGADAASTRPPVGGLIVIGAGDPGDPEITLSPITYFYGHGITVQVIAADEAAVDALLSAIGAAVEADRTLGGLCDWLDVTAAGTEDIASYDERGVLITRPARGGSFMIMASYSTSSPLG
jgi:hypothetical protein